MSNKEPFVQRFMRTTDKLQKVFGPADRDYSDPTPTDEEVQLEVEEQVFADQHWERHTNESGQGYVTER